MTVMQKQFSPLLLACLLAVTLPRYVLASAHMAIPQVYQDQDISVRAGVTGLSDRIIHFGDPLKMIVDISYATKGVNIKEPASNFFSNGWPQGKGAYLLDQKVSVRPPAGDKPGSIHAVFRFQLLACPDEKKIVCRGSRLYQVPQFSLQYQTLDKTGKVTGKQAIQFQPWPGQIMVASAITLGTEGELYRFPKYFPNGAYPDPLPGTDRGSASLGLLGGGLVFLIGGVLMSPFGFMKRKGGVKTAARWEQVLEQLRAGGYEDETHTLEAIRRCLVWYCTDELEADPFEWLKRPEESNGTARDEGGELVEYRNLFSDIIISPRGETQALLERLEQLVGNDGRQ